MGVFDTYFTTHIKHVSKTLSGGAAQKATWLRWPVPVRGCRLATSQTFTAVPAVLTRMPSTVGWNCSASTRVSSGPSTSPGPEGSSRPGAGSRHSFICGKEQVCEPRTRRASLHPACLAWGCRPYPQGPCLGTRLRVPAGERRGTWLRIMGVGEGWGKWEWRSQQLRPSLPGPPHHPSPTVLRQSGSRTAGHRQGSGKGTEHTGAGVCWGTKKVCTSPALQLCGEGEGVVGGARLGQSRALEAQRAQKIPTKSG